MTFAGPGTRLRVFSNLVVAHYVENPFDFIIDPNALSYPFQYPAYEQTELIPFRLSSYPTGRRRSSPLAFSSVLARATHQHARPAQEPIYARPQSFQYLGREEPGVQSPAETIALGTRIMSGLRGADDGGGQALGFRSAFCHRIHSDERRPARGDARLDRNLHSRRGVAWVRSDE